MFKGLGQLGDMAKLMKQAQEMQQKMLEAQNELDNVEVVGEAGGGLVKVIATAKGNFRNIEIDESILIPSEKQVIEDLLLAAIKDCKIKSEEASKKEMSKNEPEDDNKKGVFMGSAFRLGTELVAAVAVGTIIGFILDNWFGTKPWFIITFFFLGVIAGIYNVIKVAKNMQIKN